LIAIIICPLSVVSIATAAYRILIIAANILIATVVCENIIGTASFEVASEALAGQARVCLCPS
tara:strand:- start:459 stop:647 length:189 start_codon:yes stop_codon:yes gene_type:complete